jgi:hypothetical protein
MRRAVAPLALLASSVAACSGAPDPSASVVGRWTTGRQAEYPPYERTLTFHPDGRFASEVRTYGAVPGQRLGDAAGASSASRLAGTYRVSGDRLVLAADSLLWWDRFHGPDTTPRVELRPAAGSPYDGARFRIAAGVLALQYLSYPGDAPVPTAQLFRRAR